MVIAKDPFCVRYSCNESPRGAVNSICLIGAAVFPCKSVLRNHCTCVGTSRMCAAISVPAPCPGEVISTWMTPACASILAAHARSYVLPHQFPSPPAFPTGTGVEARPKPRFALQNVSPPLERLHPFISEAVNPPHLTASRSSLCSLGV